MARGGYRKPGSPAPVSGPGQLSERTDGGPGQPTMAMTGGEYGEATEMEQIQSGASMANSAAKTQKSAAAPASRPMRQAPDLFAPSERPGEPITHGSQVGPGAGQEVLSGGLVGTSPDATDVQALAAYLPELLQRAASPDAPDGFKRFVRKLRNAQPGGAM